MNSINRQQGKQQPKEEDVFDLQVGLGEVDIPVEDKHFFDIAGYLILDDLLTPEQVAEAQEALAKLVAARLKLAATLSRGPYGREIINIIETGGILEDAMALPRVFDLAQVFIWGRQFRLVGSRAIFTKSDTLGQLTQGGRASPKRYARYRSFNDGQFRCLMLTCLIALDDTATDGGAFYLIPASHKANLPHPYQDTNLAEIPPLSQIPLKAGSGIFFTESLSHAFRPLAGQTQAWLMYQYGPSYMVNWPGCEPSAELLARTDNDPAKSHLLLPAYYHPTGSQKKKGRQKDK